MKVYAKCDLIVESFNAKNKNGNKLRKLRKIEEGDIFEIKREFEATGEATHGNKCLELFGPDGETYQVNAEDFIVKSNPKPKQERTEQERLLSCIHGIIEDSKDGEFTIGFKKGGYSEEEDEGQIRLEKIVGDKKMFIQGKIGARAMNSKIHPAIVFQNSSGLNTYNKWVYPSKNKSDGIQGEN